MLVVSSVPPTWHRRAAAGHRPDPHRPGPARCDHVATGIEPGICADPPDGRFHHALEHVVRKDVERYNGQPFAASGIRELARFGVRAFPFVRQVDDRRHRGHCMSIGVASHARHHAAQQLECPFASAEHTEHAGSAGNDCHEHVGRYRGDAERAMRSAATDDQRVRRQRLGCAGVCVPCATFGHGTRRVIIERADLPRRTGHEIEAIDLRDQEPGRLLWIRHLVARRKGDREPLQLAIVQRDVLDRRAQRGRQREDTGRARRRWCQDRQPTKPVRRAHPLVRQCAHQLEPGDHRTHSHRDQDRRGAGWPDVLVDRASIGDQSRPERQRCVCREFLRPCSGVAHGATVPGDHVAVNSRSMHRFRLNSESVTRALPKWQSAAASVAGPHRFQRRPGIAAWARPSPRGPRRRARRRVVDPAQFSSRCAFTMVRP